MIFPIEGDIASMLVFLFPMKLQFWISIYECFFTKTLNNEKI